ncbi:hypothetical protein [Streptomyces sp. NPDC090056]|uniref:hypothetical protein n=1 Tax=Streptomyces sp. NPDC090056 TaxID=3365934 RepID=UPI00382F6AC5
MAIAVGLASAPDNRLRQQRAQQLGRLRFHVRSPAEASVDAGQPRCGFAEGVHVSRRVVGQEDLPVQYLVLLGGEEALTQQSPTSAVSVRAWAAPETLTVAQSAHTLLTCNYSG